MLISDSAPSRRERRKQEIRARLLDSAVALFVAHGYAATSVSDIAERADVARATAFNYFPRKEDYFVAWMEARREAFRAAFADPALAGLATASRLLRGFETLGRFYDTDPAGRPMVREWLKAGGPLLAQASDSAGMVTTVLAAGQAAGDIRADLDVALAGRVVLDVYLGALYRWGRAEGTVLAGSLARALGLVLDGFSVRP
jgi:AcrR family transcriptional regulator